MKTYNQVERITSRYPMTIEEINRMYAGELEAGNKVDIQFMCSRKVAIVKIAYPKNK